MASLPPIESAAQVVAQGLAVWTAWGGSVDQFNAWMMGGAFGGDGQGRYPLTNRAGTAVLVKCLARLVYEATRIEVVELAGADAYALDASHYGRKVRLTAASVATLPVTLPADAPIGTTILLRGTNSQVKLAVAAGGALVSWAGHNGSAASGAAVSVSVEANAGNTAQWVLDGATGLLA